MNCSTRETQLVIQHLSTVKQFSDITKFDKYMYVLMMQASAFLHCCIWCLKWNASSVFFFFFCSIPEFNHQLYVARCRQTFDVMAPTSAYLQECYWFVWIRFCSHVREFVNISLARFYDVWVLYIFSYRRSNVVDKPFFDTCKTVNLWIEFADKVWL